MSNQTITLRTHTQLAQYKQTIAESGERGTACIDYIIQAKQDKIIRKLEALVPLPPPKDPTKEIPKFTGKFKLTNQDVYSCEKKIRKIEVKEELITIIEDWDSIKSKEQLKKYYSKI